MHIRSQTLPFVAMALLGCAAPHSVVPQRPEGPPIGSDDSSDLESRLMGTWILVASDVPGSPSGIGIRRRIYSPGRWEIIQTDPATGKIVFNHGGTYRIHGDEVEHTVEFAGQSTASFLHQVRRFKIKVEGDTLTQVGLGNPFNDVWRRVPNK
jgi:hypothetical protein